MSLPDCFGKWMSKPSNKCEGCSNQLQCYSKMHEDEKKKEKLKTLKNDIPWYKRNKDDLGFQGVCDKCG